MKLTNVEPNDYGGVRLTFDMGNDQTEVIDFCYTNSPPWRRHGLGVSRAGLCTLFGCDDATLRGMERGFSLMQSMVADKVAEMWAAKKELDETIQNRAYYRRNFLREVRAEGKPDELHPDDRPTQLRSVKHLREYCLDTVRPSYVYFLVRDDVVVYVGKTDTPMPIRPMRGHKEKVYDRILYIETAPDEVYQVERRYIKRFKPEYNSQGVPKPIGAI